MKQYLMSIYTPQDGTPPSPEALGSIMHELDVLNAEMRQAGAWVFNGGLSAEIQESLSNFKVGLFAWNGPATTSDLHVSFQHFRIVNGVSGFAGR